MPEQETTAQKAVMFDPAQPIEVRLNTAAGIKSMSVRFPKNDEWIERAKKRRIVTTQLGRGRSVTQVADSDEIDLGFFHQLAVDKSDIEIDGTEATRIIEMLGAATAIDIAESGNMFVITLLVVGGRKTIHNLTIPSTPDIDRFRRAYVRQLELPANKRELRVNLDAAAQLYKNLSEGTEGYVGGSTIPITHQAAALLAAIEKLESLLEVEPEENF